MEKEEYTQRRRSIAYRSSSLFVGGLVVVGSIYFLDSYCSFLGPMGHIQLLFFSAVTIGGSAISCIFLGFLN